MKHRERKGEKVKGEDKICRGYSEKAWNMRGCGPRTGVAEFILRGTMT